MDAAVALAEAGDYRAAVAAFGALALADPSAAARAHESRAQCLLELDAADADADALAAAALAAELDTSFLAARVTRARCHMRLRQWAEAAACYAAAGAEAPPAEAADAARLAAEALVERLPLNDGRFVRVQQRRPASGSGCGCGAGTASGAGTGGSVWEAGIVLARWADHAFPAGYWRGKTVLELGCGTGLVGLACAALGATAVLTDASPEAVALAAANAAANADLLAAAGGAARAEPLDWEADETERAPPPPGGSAAACGRAGTALPVRPDCVMCADAVFSDTALRSGRLVALLAAASRGGASVFLAHKRRHASVDAALLEALRVAGVAVDEQPLETLDPDYRSERIAVFALAASPLLHVAIAAPPRPLRPPSSSEPPPLSLSSLSLSLSPPPPPLPRVLVVGDGDYSYGLLLANARRAARGTAAGLAVTGFDPPEALAERHPGAAATMAALEAAGATAAAGVDAREAAQLAAAGGPFDEVVFMFPQAPERRKIDRHRALLRGFFAAAASPGVLAAAGRVRVALLAGQGGSRFEPEGKRRPPGDTWQLVECAAAAGLVLTACVPARVEALFPFGYASKGFRGQDRGFLNDGTDGLCHVLRRPGGAAVAVDPPTHSRDVSFYREAGVGDAACDAAFLALAHATAAERGAAVRGCDVFDSGYVEPATGREARGYRLKLSGPVLCRAAASDVADGILAAIEGGRLGGAAVR